MNLAIDHPTDRANFAIVTIGYVRVAFSYVTPIGVNLGNGKGWVIRENVWGPTTGKHMNFLDPVKDRISGERFREILDTLRLEDDTL